MLSPDSLVITGNIAGHLGVKLAFPLALITGLYLLNGAVFHRLSRIEAGAASEAIAIQKAINMRWVGLIPLFLRIPITLFAATGALVSAGFVFNETFIHWFPNFAFAYLLLGLVSGTILLSRKAAECMQLLLWIMVLSGLISLTIISLFTAGFSQPPSSLPPSSGSLQFFIFPLFLMVGFDLLFINSAKTSTVTLTRAMIIGVLMGGLLHLVWGVVSAGPAVVHAADVKLVTKEQLKEMLDDPNLAILDVRTGRDWTSSEFKIKGALRTDPDALETWSGTLQKDKKLVLYCA